MEKINGLTELTKDELIGQNGGFLLMLANAYLGVAVYYTITDPEGVLRGITKIIMGTLYCTESLEELKLHESMNTFGGEYNPAEMVGLGIASAILFGYFGTLGMAYAYYNFFKNS